MKKTIVMILILMSSFSFAKDVNFPAVIAAKNSDSMVIFKRCYWAEACQTVGNPEGYHIDRLDFNPVKDKFKAVGLGLGEGAIGIVAGWFTSWGAYAAGASDTGVWATFYAASAGLTALPSIISEKFNPIFKWQMASVKSVIDKKNFAEDNVVIIDFLTEKKMNKFVLALRGVLRTLPESVE